MPFEAFHSQVVIVTGASSGISRALALQSANQGAKVTSAAREYAIPAVLTTGIGTRRIKDRAIITVDGERGFVELVYVT